MNSGEGHEFVCQPKYETAEYEISALFAGGSPTRSTRSTITDSVLARIDAVLTNASMVTAFQPIHDLATGQVIGAEGLTRFGIDAKSDPHFWFSKATSAGLGADLEIAAIEVALASAAQLPAHLYVSVNLSPRTFLDRRLIGLLRKAPIAEERIILELTEHSPVDDYAALLTALALPRKSGIRLAIDDVGAGYASMRHIVQLAPEMIKLDKTLITGINSHSQQFALGASMVELARRIGATLVAEGIETREELSSVSALGMTAAQGFFLGRPSVNPDQWARWQPSKASSTLRLIDQHGDTHTPYRLTDQRHYSPLAPSTIS